METIIQQICMNIVEKVLKTLKESKNLSLDIITPEIREESNNTCLSIVEEYIYADGGRCIRKMVIKLILVFIATLEMNNTGTASIRQMKNLIGVYSIRKNSSSMTSQLQEF